MQTTQELVAMVRSAWEDAQPPANENISRPTCDDEGVSAYFSGKTWKGHTARQLRQLDFAPCIFTHEAFAYYLPAYLIADIEDPETSDTNMERVVFWLDPDHGWDLAAQGPTVIDRLTAPQRSALRQYILFIERREQGFHDELWENIGRRLDEADA